MKYLLKTLLLFLLSLSIINCNSSKAEDNSPDSELTENNEENPTESVKRDLKNYKLVSLTTDLSNLTNRQKAMLVLFIQAAEIMDKMFWYEAYGDKSKLLSDTSDELKNYVRINYGPWDRLNNNIPFIDGVGEKPLGANFYPSDMTREEFEKADLKDGNSLHTFIRRDKKGELYTVPYNKHFKSEISTVKDLLKRAASYAEDAGLKEYLLARAKAFETDDYLESDFAWMDMKDNEIDFIIGPIETYEDRLFGYKASHSAYVLVKDMEWSKRLAHYVDLLPELQRSLPVGEEYKTEIPGTESDLNAYDVIYYAGDCNAGGKTIAINLPNDERVQLEKGTRRLQLKNAMQAKFDHIMMPIADILIDSEQRNRVNFDAFFTNVMFHEVAHGLGIKNTINDKGTVRGALKDQQSHLEEEKADILGLYMITQLIDMKELHGNKADFMVTFLVGIFRSVRFGHSAHGTANMITFNYFKEKGAFVRNEDGTYKVNFNKMESAIESLSELILKLQGNGDYEGVIKLTKEKGIISEELQEDLNKLESAGIPDDIVFEQGIDVLGL